MQLSHEMLIESKSIRSEKLKEYSDAKALDALNKAKALVAVYYKNEQRCTTEQLAEFYQIPVNTLQKLYKRHSDEFAQEVEKLTGKQLRGVTDIMSVSPNAPSLLIWSPRGAIRAGMLLQDSEVAKQVRNILLDTVDAAGVLAEQVVKLQEEVTKYQNELIKVEEKIIIYERWIERVKIKDTWVRLGETTEKWTGKHPEYLKERNIDLDIYLAGLCNALYTMMWGMGKRSICESYDIEYNDDEIIRDYAPKHHLEILSKVEETAIEIIEVYDSAPDRAIQKAGMMVSIRVKQLYRLETKKSYRTGTTKEMVRFGFPFVKQETKPVYLTQEVGNAKLPDLEEYLEMHRKNKYRMEVRLFDIKSQLALHAS